METALFMKYKSSYSAAFIDLSTHSCILSASCYSLWYLRNSWLSVITIPLFGMLNIKTFMIFHDCGHNSYTPNKTLNYMIGVMLSSVLSHPFFWNYDHKIHHNVNGNKENKYEYNFNETVFYTLKQYNSWSPISRCLYKYIRTPFFFFTIPIYLKILILNQFNLVLYKIHDCKISTPLLIIEQSVSTCSLLFILYMCNVYNILIHVLMSYFVGFTITVMLVHNEHTYNPSYVVENNVWTYKDSGLRGSSFILIPRAFKYFFHGIEYHHIHHMNSKIPGYNLQKYHEEATKNNMFDNIVKLSLKDCYNNLWLSLYDEDNKKYITFEEIKDKYKCS